jgi:hypothetical protein
MDVFTHILFGALIGYFFHGTQISLWWVAVLGAILPDLIGETLYQIGRVVKGKKTKFIYDKEVSKSHTYLGDSKFLYPYNLMHSLVIIPILFIFSVQIDFIVAYLSHILLDLVSHSRKTWGIMIFWPFSRRRFGVNKDWWEWEFFKKIYGKK